MKKLYTLALAVAVAASASAAQRSVNVNQAGLKAVPSLSATAVSDSHISLVKKSTTMKKSAGFSSIAEMEGSWQWVYFNLLSDYDGLSGFEATFTVSNAAANEITISGFPQDFKVVATVDLTAGTFTIKNNQNLGEDSYGDINYFYLKGLDDEFNLTDVTADNIVASIADDVITFESYDVLAIGDPSAEDLGWWFLTALNATTPIDVWEGWEDCGDATFTDGWILPGMGYDQTEYPWVVTLQKSTTEAGIYRLKTPYQIEACPFYQAAASTTPGFITFNVSNPDFVVLYPNIYGGFDNGTNKMCMFNIEGFFMDQGYDEAEIKEGLEGSVSAWSTYADGVVTVQNCRFNYTSDPSKAYSWVDETNQSLADKMVATITMPTTEVNGVSNISVADENAPVEYFNLQGVRVDNPSNGLYIRRQGNTATKVLVNK